MRCLASSPPKKHHIKLRTDSAHWRANHPYIVGATLAVALLIPIALLIPVALLIPIILLIPVALLIPIILLILVALITPITLLILHAGTRTSFHSTGSSSSTRLCKRAGST